MMYPRTPARLDADKTAKPLTRIVTHPKLGHCIRPGMLDNPEYETAEGKRIPLMPKLRGPVVARFHGGHREGSSSNQEPDPRMFTYSWVSLTAHGTIRAFDAGQACERAHASIKDLVSVAFEGKLIWEA